MAEFVGRRKSILWITIIGVLITIPVSYLLIKWTRSNLLSTLNHRAIEELKVHMAHVQSEMDHRHTLTRMVAADERVLSFMKNPETAELRTQVNRYLKLFKETAGSIAYLLNTEGIVLASGNWDMQESFVGHDLSFRPYYKAAVVGKNSQFVAIGTVSHRLGYYVSTPIRVGKTIIGVAVTKTNPQQLIMSHQTERPLIITDQDGVAIISNTPQYLFHTLPGESRLPPKRLSRFQDMELKQITASPMESVGRLRLIRLPATGDSNMDSDGDVPRQFLLARATIPGSGWKAHLLWPTDDLDSTLMQRRLISVLALILAGLLCLYAHERWVHVKQMQEHAFRDPLTKLYTRLYMLESATALLAAHDRNSIAGVSAIMFDLDWFKKINDQYGHSAGDNVLVQVAGVISKECRDSDIPIRYGGEEFLVFIPSGNQGNVLQLAERIRSEIKNLDIRLAGRPVRITISGGIAAHMPGEPLEKLIDRADHKMYLAKQSGRDQINMGADAQETDIENTLNDEDEAELLG